MLCLSYQYGDRSYNEDSGASLSIRCYRSSQALVALAEDGPATFGDPPQTVAIMQAYFLSKIFAMLYLPSSGIGGSNRNSSCNHSNNNINNTSSSSNSHEYQYQDD